MSSLKEWKDECQAPESRVLDQTDRAPWLRSWTVVYYGNLCSYRMKPLFTARTKSNNEESTLDLCIDQTDRTPCFKWKLFLVFVLSFLKMKRFMWMIANFKVTGWMLERSLKTKRGDFERPTAVYCLLPNYNRRYKLKMIVKIFERRISLHNRNLPGSKISITSIVK